MKQKYELWINKFMDGWKNLDYKSVLKLISKDCRYYENPIDKPCESFIEIENLWKVIKNNQKDISYTYEIVSFDEEKCIVNFQMKRYLVKDNKEQSIDGIFLISLNDDDKCTLFKQWRYTK